MNIINHNFENILNIDIDNVYNQNIGYNKTVRFAFFSVGFLSIGGITFYYIKNRFGKIIKTTFVCGLWEVFKLETIAKMTLCKLFNTFSNFCISPITNIVTRSVDEQEDVSYYMNGRLIKKKSYLDSLTYEPIEEYNLIIYKIKENNEYYYKLFENHEDINDELEKSTVRFLSAELSIDGIQNKIPLKFNDLNIFIKGNKLFTRAFISWFMMEKYGIRLNEDTNYTVYTIDNQITIDNFENSSTSYQYAVINTTGYDKEVITHDTLDGSCNDNDNSNNDNVNTPDVISNSDDLQNDVVLSNKEKCDIQVNVEDSSGLLTNVIYSWFGYKKSEWV